MARKSRYSLVQMANSSQRQCVFCDNKADEREHIIPKWILKKLEWGRGPFHISFDNKTPIEMGSPEHKARVVCKACNHGWMSDLEQAVKPILSPLMFDISVSLDLPQQYTVVKWAVKTAMVHDGSARQRPMRYEREMCESLRSRSTIPPRTTVWIARCSSPRAIAGALVDTAHTVGDNVRIGARSCVMTLVLGYLAIQVLTVVPDPQYRNAAIPLNPKAGPWDRTLIRLWPPRDRAVTWPQPETFLLSGDRSVFILFDRWRLGERGRR
jgi:hypothetical protein